MLYHQSKNLPPPVVLRSPLGPPNANSKWLEVTFVTFTTLTVEFYSTLKRFYCLSRSASFLSVSTAKYKSHVSVNSGGVVCRGWFLMWSRATATFTQAPVSQCRLWPKQEPVFFLKKAMIFYSISTRYSKIWLCLFNSKQLWAENESVTFKSL